MHKLSFGVRKMQSERATCTVDPGKILFLSGILRLLNRKSLLDLARHIEIAFSLDTLFILQFWSLLGWKQLR